MPTTNAAGSNRLPSSLASTHGDAVQREEQEADISAYELGSAAAPGTEVRGIGQKRATELDQLV
jgi:hypothetical protein